MASETKQAEIEKNDTNHSPLPWTTDREDGYAGGRDISDAAGEFIVTAYETDAKGDTQGRENAKFILRACNFHERLVDALRHDHWRNHEFSEGCTACTKSRALLSEISKAAE